MLASLVLARAIRLASQHVAGCFGTDESYDKAFVPWDEMLQDIIRNNPEMYEESELVLETEHEHAPVKA